MGKPIIQLVELSKKYGEHTAVDKLTLSIEKGEIFGLLGPNGAGKSTTILMMLGLSEPYSGKVKVCGVDSTRQPLHVKQKVGYLPDDIGFYEDLTGLENILYTAKLNRIPDDIAQQQAAKLLERVGLANASEKKAGTYSRGMRQRLGLADVLIKNPEVIILDEPTLGIDPQGVKELLSLIHQLSRDEGITVLLSSHHLHQVQQICDRVGLFVQGKLLAAGDVESLSKQLFDNEPVFIYAQVDEASDLLIEQLSQIKSIEQIERSGDELHFKCSSDVSAEIAATIVNNGGKLYSLNKKVLGLDEIYQRYFEGGDHDAAKIY